MTSIGNSIQKEEIPNWSFGQTQEWQNKFPQCAANSARVAPINIDTNNVAICHNLCKLAINYNETKCHLQFKNGMPTVYFDPGSYCKFKGTIYNLKMMTIHKPSMHTINHNNYDMEVLLYHSLNPTSIDDGGVIISFLFKKGKEYGDVNTFFNEFINQIPTNEVGKELEIETSEDWSPRVLFPDSKSFFYYNGALPYPPCSPNWSVIVFEETIGIAENIINTVKYVLGDSSQNIRNVMKTPKNITVFYNNYQNFQDEITTQDKKKGSGKEISRQKGNTSYEYV